MRDETRWDVFEGEGWVFLVFGGVWDNRFPDTGVGMGKVTSLLRCKEK